MTHPRQRAAADPRVKAGGPRRGRTIPPEGNRSPTVTWPWNDVTPRALSAWSRWVSRGARRWCSALHSSSSSSRGGGDDDHHHHHHHRRGTRLLPGVSEARRGARGRWRALWIGALCAAPTCLRLRPAVVVVAAAATVGVRGEQLLRVEQQEESSSFSPRPENPQWGAGSSPWVSAAWLFPCVYFMCFYFHGELGRADSRRRGWAARLPHRPRRVRDSAARPRLLFPRSSEGSEDLPAAPGPNRRRRAALSWRSGRQLGGSRAGVPSPLMTAPLPNPAAAAKLEGEPRVFLQLLRSTIEKIHNRIKFSQKPSLPTSHGVRGRAAFLLHSARQRKAVRRPLVTVWSFLTTVRSLLKFLLCWRCGVGASSCRCFCSERSYRRTDRQHSPSAQSWCCTSWKATFSSFFLLFVSQQVSDQRFNFILFFLRPRSARMSS